MNVKCLTTVNQVKILIDQARRVNLEAATHLKYLSIDFLVTSVSLHALFWLKLNGAKISYTLCQTNTAEIVTNIENSWPEAHMLEIKSISDFINLGKHFYKESEEKNFLTSQVLVSGLCTIRYAQLERAYQSQLPNDSKLVIQGMVDSVRSELGLFEYDLELAQIKPFVTIIGQDNELVFDEKVLTKTYISLNKETANASGKITLLNLYQNIPGVKKFNLTTNFLTPKTTQGLLIKESYKVNGAWLNMRNSIPTDLYVAIASFESCY